MNNLIFVEISNFSIFSIYNTQIFFNFFWYFTNTHLLKYTFYISVNKIIHFSIYHFQQWISSTKILQSQIVQVWVIELVQLAPLAGKKKYKEKIPFQGRTRVLSDNIVGRCTRRVIEAGKEVTPRKTVYSLPLFFTDLHHACRSRLVFITPGFTTTFFSASVLCPPSWGRALRLVAVFSLRNARYTATFSTEFMFPLSLSLSRLPPWLFITMQTFLPGVELINYFEVIN